MICVGDT